ncbi:MAG: type I restriction-modification system subunit M N-terminal domain-containing protein [Steroidobacteraceae bacterium]
MEGKLWAAADAVRNNIDTTEYKHVVLGVIFLKYVSDTFEAKYAGNLGDISIDGQKTTTPSCGLPT